jgi:hypothetical protein
MSAGATPAVQASAPGSSTSSPSRRERWLCIRTIGIVQAKVKIGLANLTYNIRRLVFHEGRRGTA